MEWLGRGGWLDVTVSMERRRPQWAGVTRNTRPGTLGWVCSRTGRKKPWLSTAEETFIVAGHSFMWWPGGGLAT